VRSYLNDMTRVRIMQPRIVQIDLVVKFTEEILCGN